MERVQGESSHKKARLQEEEEQVLSESSDDDPFNPERTVTKKYYLVHRQDVKMCPKKVTTCQSCPNAFLPSDIVVIRTVGTRVYLDKHGKEKTATGNIYLHFLEKCLKNHEKSFSYSKVHITKRTQELCPKAAHERFRKRRMKFDEA